MKPLVRRGSVDAAAGAAAGWEVEKEEREDGLIAFTRRRTSDWAQRVE